MQVISVTAISGTTSLVETRPTQAAVIPMRPDDYCLSSLVPRERRPKFHNVSKQDLPQQDGLPRGVCSMIESMLEEGIATCADLIQSEVEVREQARLQYAIIARFGTLRVAVVTHNGGSDLHARRQARNGSQEHGSKYCVQSYHLVYAQDACRGGCCAGERR